MNPMSRIVMTLVLWAVGTAFAAAQQSSSQPKLPRNQAPPRAEDDSASQAEASTADDRASAEESSSKEHRVDITPPKDDAKNHPFSASATDEAEPPSDVQDFHPWNPHKAAKDVEIGEFYLKRKNYRAAADRFREALIYKQNDAIATFRLGEALEKLGQADEARASYEGYLKILPEGPLSPEAHKAIDRLSKKQSKNETK
jgi:tetratricopeptide (TPR) repeat protein